MERDRGTCGPGAKRSIGQGVGRTAVEGGGGACEGRRRAVPISFIVLPDAEESGGLEAHSEFEAAKQAIYSAKEVSDGNVGIYHSFAEKGHVGGELGSEGRISTYPDPCGFPEVFGVSLQERGLQVRLPTVWPVDGTQGVYQGNAGNSVLSSEPRSESVRLPGRLAHSGGDAGGNVQGGVDYGGTAGGVGLDLESGEVQSGSMSRDCLSWSKVGSSSGSRVPVGEEVDQDDSIFRPVPVQTSTSGEGLVGLAGIPGQSNGGGPLVQAAHASDPGAREVALPADGGAIDGISSFDGRSESAHRLVDRGTQCVPGTSFSGPASSNDPDDRRFSVGLGSLLEGRYRVRDLDDIRIEVSYKLAGADGSLESVSGLEGGPEGSLRDGVHGQFDNSMLHQSSRRDEVIESVSSGHGSSVALPGDECRAESYSSSRRGERVGGRAVERKVRRERVEFVADLGESSVPDLRSSVCRSLRVGRKQEVGDLCVEEVRPGGVGRRRAVVRLDRTVGVCVSSTESTTVRIEQGGVIQDASVVGGAVLAESTVVPDAVVAPGRLPVPVPRKRRIGYPGQRKDTPQRLTPSTPLCLETFRSRLRKAGFQGEAVDLAARSRRVSTIRTYDARLGGFYAWARRKAIDPLEATLKQVADFLMHLYHKGLQVSTIRHYRSAIGAVHSGFTDGSKVGDNEFIRSLLKGMFNARPPQRRLAPAWSINEVLVSLAKAPYEPMESISLDLLTSKTAFLVAAASGRRRSFIHALTTQEGFLRFTSRGVTMLPNPAFLSKNQTAEFTPEPLFLPRLTETSMTREDKFWCPVRALSWYLKRTSHLRSLGSDQLFILTRSPHGPASKSVISRWISNLIKSTVRSPEGVRTHDIRGQAASKAWFSRVPLEDILKAASWKTPSTFVSCYLTDVLSAEGEFSRCVLRVPNA